MTTIVIHLPLAFKLSALHGSALGGLGGRLLDVRAWDLFGLAGSELTVKVVGPSFLDSASEGELASPLRSSRKPMRHKGSFTIVPVLLTKVE